MSDITFFAWGDTHFGYDQKFYSDDLRGRIIRQMNDLPGWPFPHKIGGTVSNPDFVVCCGDMVDNDLPGLDQYEFDVYKYFSSKLNFNQYEVMGNHDDTAILCDYFMKKYGGKSYSFDVKNVHFVSLNSDYDRDEVGHIPEADLEWLRSDLGALPSACRIVIFTHTRIDSLKNPDQLLKVLNAYNVILIVSAHKHHPAAFKYNGLNCISIGHCRSHPIDPEYGRSFHVVRISENRILAVPWRWDFLDWERGQRWTRPENYSSSSVLDAEIN